MKSIPYCFVIVLALFPLVFAGTIVTTAADEDDGLLGGGNGISLREAVKYSGSGSIITFSAALSGQIIYLSSGSLLIDKSLTIDGSALPAGLTLSADRTGNGKSSDDTYAILLTGGDLILDSLILTGANCGESSGCITIQPSVTFTLTLDHCTLTRNAGYHASALYCSSRSTQPTDSITIRTSTISRNSVVKGASVVAVAYRNFIVGNCTFSQNETGAISYCSSTSKGVLSISNSTISGNSSNYGAGGLYIDNDGINLPGAIYLNNTLCTGNKLANIYNASPGATIIGSNNIFSGAPLLAPLGDYGGPTQTMPPLPGSPVIHAGSTTALVTDQRGFPRVGMPDIGAAEYQENADLTRFWKMDFDGDGSSYGVEQAMGSDPLVSDSINSRNLGPPVMDAAGHVVLGFGLASAPVHGTRWILKRSPDLGSGAFTEIYRYDGTTDTAIPGVSFVRNASSVTVTDENPFLGGGFYRFEAVLEP